MYMSRLEELNETEGVYSSLKAAIDFASHLQSVKTDNLIELTYAERKRVHNLKYYTWVEQQGRTAEELNDQWYHQDKTFKSVQTQAMQIDELINEFNAAVGLLSAL